MSRPAGVTDEAERDRLIDELRQAQDQLRADLEAMTRLHELGSLFVREGNLEPVLVEIVDAAIAISAADFGNIQLLDPESSDLKIVAQRGFPDWWLEFWNTVSKGHGVCGTALERGERVIVEDVERSPIFAGTPALEIQRRAGVRAVQSTPLVSRVGKPLGMFSTHWRKPGRPDERSLRVLYARARRSFESPSRTLPSGSPSRHPTVAFWKRTPRTAPSPGTASRSSGTCTPGSSSTPTTSQRTTGRSSACWRASSLTS